jgi:hypothetical protein
MEDNTRPDNWPDANPELYEDPKEEKLCIECEEEPAEEGSETCKDCGEALYGKDKDEYL